MEIPVAKPYLTEEDARSAYDTILSGWITQGPMVQEFEEKFARYVGAKYAVAVSSCTSALHLSILAAGIKPGDEVICPSMSFIATANSITYAGAKPVFADIDPETYNMDVNSARKSITDKTKAILIVHQAGMPADIDAFKELCSEYHLMLLEDAACAAGSAYKGTRIGAHSDLVCFSFHPRKLITTGDGGMITTSCEKLYDRLRLLRQHGMSINDRERHTSKNVMFEEYLEIGYNYRMTDIQAAVGTKQLEKLDWILSERRKIAMKYNEAFRDMDNIRLPTEKDGCLTNYQSYIIFLKDSSPVLRNDLMQELLNKGISTRRGIMAIHTEPAYKQYCQGLQLPVTEMVSDRSIILPLYVPMKTEEIEYVIKYVRKYARVSSASYTP